MTDQPTRTLTPREHDRAWHAIEGSIGEEGADPGTVLAAVLHALNITPPTVWDEQAASPRRQRTASEPGIVAYRNSDRPGVLLCREHGEGWMGMTPLTSDDLPDGGICTWGPNTGPQCGRDVLILAPVVGQPAEAHDTDTSTWWTIQARKPEGRWFNLSEGFDSADKARHWRDTELQAANWPLRIVRVETVTVTVEDER